MQPRPWTLLAATVFLLVSGLSGAGVGLSLLVALGQVSGATATGLAIGGGFLAYGVALAIAGIGLLVWRRWAWWLGVASIVLGLLVLSALVVGAGSDAVLEGGILLWAAVLALLLAPPTRRSLKA
jgi:hypothetical protein